MAYLCGCPSESPLVCWVCYGGLVTAAIGIEDDARVAGVHYAMATSLMVHGTVLPVSMFQGRVPMLQGCCDLSGNPGGLRWWFVHSVLYDFDPGFLVFNGQGRRVGDGQFAFRIAQRVVDDLPPCRSGFAADWAFRVRLVEADQALIGFQFRQRARVLRRHPGQRLGTLNLFEPEV